MSVGNVDKVDGILLVVLVWENRTQGTHFLKVITYATFVVFGLLILDWFSGNEFFWVTVSAPRILISQECISYWRHLIWRHHRTWCGMHQTLPIWHWSIGYINRWHDWRSFDRLKTKPETGHLTEQKTDQTTTLDISPLTSGDELLFRHGNFR